MNIPKLCVYFFIIIIHVCLNGCQFLPFVGHSSDSPGKVEITDPIGFLFVEEGNFCVKSNIRASEFKEKKGFYVANLDHLTVHNTEKKDDTFKLTKLEFEQIDYSNEPRKYMIRIIDSQKVQNLHNKKNDFQNTKKTHININIHGFNELPPGDLLFNHSFQGSRFSQFKPENFVINNYSATKIKLYFISKRKDDVYHDYWILNLYFDTAKQSHPVSHRKAISPDIKILFPHKGNFNIKGSVAPNEWESTDDGLWLGILQTFTVNNDYQLVGLNKSINQRSDMAEYSLIVDQTYQGNKLPFYINIIVHGLTESPSTLSFFVEYSSQQDGAFLFLSKEHFFINNTNPFKMNFEKSDVHLYWKQNNNINNKRITTTNNRTNITDKIVVKDQKGDGVNNALVNIFCKEPFHSRIIHQKTKGSCLTDNVLLNGFRKVISVVTFSSEKNQMRKTFNDACLDTIYTDINGIAEFTINRPIEECYFSIAKEGYLSETGKLINGKSVELKEQLKNENKMTVVSEKGKPIADANVVIQDESNDINLLKKTDPNGLVGISAYLDSKKEITVSITKKGYYIDSFSIKARDLSGLQRTLKKFTLPLPSPPTKILPPKDSLLPPPIPQPLPLPKRVSIIIDETDSDIKARAFSICKNAVVEYFKKIRWEQTPSIKSKISIYVAYLQRLKLLNSIDAIVTERPKIGSTFSIDSILNKAISSFDDTIKKKKIIYLMSSGRTSVIPDNIIDLIDTKIMKKRNISIHFIIIGDYGSESLTVIADESGGSVKFCNDKIEIYDQLFLLLQSLEI